MKALVLLYRFMRFRKGYGVHSPFAFDLITNVIEERYAYPCYGSIEQLRRRLMRDNTPLGGSRVTVRQATRRHAIARKRGQLLFRLANYLGPKRLLQVGTGVGISTLYMTAYSSNLRCISLEEDRQNAELAQRCVREGSREVEIMHGRYEATLPEALERLGVADFIFFSAGITNPYGLFERCTAYIQPESILVVEGLYDNPEMRGCWQRIKAHPSVTLTFDLYHMGLVFFNKRFYRKDYIVYF